jgi:ATP-binding cassette subfamily B protein
MSYTREEILAKCRLTEDGISLFDLQRAAESIGLRALSIHCTIEELVERIPLPAIALWTGNHYVIVADADDNCIHVLDPARGSMNYSYNEFQSGWYQEGRKDGVLMVVDK